MSDILSLPREALERARRSRDPRFDGKFFVAVLSTGIYCRSICPVRMSLSVRYYATAAAAEEAGFRPCLRCRPEAAPGSSAWIGTSAVVRRALRLIEDGALDKGSVQELAAQLGMGARHLDRLLLDKVGASPLVIAQMRRLHFAKRLLDESNLSVTDVASASGFQSLRRFNEAVKAKFKRTPQDLRRRRVRSEDAADEITLRLSYRPPYDWAHMLGYLARHAIQGLERVDAGSYTRTVRTSAGHAIVQMQVCDANHTLRMRVQGAPLADLFELSSAARRVFDLAADPEQIAAAFRGDIGLEPLVARRPGLRIPGFFDPFECAVRAILGQRVSPERERAYTRRIVERAGQLLAPCHDTLTHLFPSPATLAAVELADLGLPAARADTLRALARAVRDGRLCFKHSTMEVIRAISTLEGVDAATAQYVALRGLGDPDAFPSNDPILRRAVSAGGPIVTARTLEARAEAWRPWRGYAVVHLWAATPELPEWVRPAGRTTKKNPARGGASGLPAAI